MAGNASTRYLVWDELNTALVHIVEASGFWNTVVVQSLEPPEPDATGGPWIVMSPGEEDMGEPSCGRRYSPEWTINLDCYVVKSSTAVLDLMQLTQDVRRTVSGAGPSIADRVTDAVSVTLGGAENFEGVLNHNDGHVVARETVLVAYHTKDAW